jgi:hypothetical protein
MPVIPVNKVVDEKRIIGKGHKNHKNLATMPSFSVPSKKPKRNLVSPSFRSNPYISAANKMEKGVEEEEKQGYLCTTD